ncbi:hypothetical protein [Candidatus Amarolinea dominans]|uniref:hypothetical protein n=1 Tax=Candidatus Amarolinea dominans TaxID=3140696 RepID=UPI001DB67E80|nr:hypothetical protein [Anaerolineae bacterium]
MGSAGPAARRARLDHRGVWSRSPDSAARLAQQVGAAAWTDPARLAEAQLVLLTVPDGAIAACCQAVAQAGGWRSGQGVVHCSGAVEVSALAPAQVAGAVIGGFHPLQAFATVEAAGGAARQFLRPGRRRPAV